MRSVQALVLTHNSPETLRRTVDALLAQERRPDAVVVVDNAGIVPAAVTLADLVADGDVSVLRCEDNTGPAGGWATALGHFLQSGLDAAWLLDDDIVAPPATLTVLLEELDAGWSYVLPSVRQPSGAVTTYPAWHGVLLDRPVVERAGLPRADFFWWSEDTEYLMWRMAKLGYPLHVTDRVVVDHLKGRGARGNPPWAYYYEMRNSVYSHLWLLHGRGRWPRKVMGLTARAVLEQRRWDCLRLSALGAVDGLLGRLGEREDFV